MKEANDNATDPGFLPCPFCDEQAALQITSGAASCSVVCNCCLAAGGESDSITGAIQAWNTRAPVADAVRGASAKMLTALKDIILWAERHSLTKADLITGGQAECPVITNARAAIALAEGTGLPAPTKTISIHIEGGLVQDVTGIPAGYEVRVEDYDLDDPSDEGWDAEKGCVVSVYGGGAHG